MKKLILLLLISLILNLNPQCKEYEVFDEDNKKCEKFCEENEYYNYETEAWHVKFIVKREKFII